MSLSQRLNAIESEARALRARVAELEQWKVGVEQALAAEEADEQQDTQTTTLDGERVESRERDQNESLG